MKINRALAVMAIIGTIFAPTGGALGQQGQDRQISAIIEAMRKDVREQKQSLVDQAMELEAGDKAKFQAVYDSYQKETETLWNQLLVNIKKYADNYDNMSDKIADEIALKAMDIDAQRAKIRRKYYEQVKSALGARLAMRFLQTEVVIDHLVDLQISSSIPTMKYPVL